MTNKFEKLIEYIINDEDQKARELFHTIVVEKSRDIYESIMSDEQMEEMVSGAPVRDELDELSDQNHMDEVSEEEEEFDHDADAEEFDIDEPEEFGDEEETEGNPAEEEIEDKVMNIDAKLDELLAKFDEIMGGDEHGEEHDAEHGEEHDEEPADVEMFEAEEEEESKGNPFVKKDEKKKTEESRSNKSTTELMREYVDTISKDIYSDSASEGDAVGAAGKKISVNTKSEVGPGADFGGSVVKTDTKEQNQDGTRPTRASNEYTKGEGKLIGKVANTPGGNKTLQSTGDEYSKEHPADGTAVGNDGKLTQNHKSVQKQNTGKK